MIVRERRDLRHVGLTQDLVARGGHSPQLLANDRRCSTTDAYVDLVEDQRGPRLDP